MRTVFILAVLVLMIYPACAEPELKGAPGELTSYLSSIPKTVSVTGDAELKVEADRARVVLKVSTENKSLEEALKKNSMLRGQVAENLKKNGIPPENIIAARFSSTPQYGLFSEKARSYRVENVIRVAVRIEEEFRTVATAVDAHQDVSYQGIDFESSNEAELKGKVLGEACKAAVRKKQLYEDTLGVKLIPRAFIEKTVEKELPFKAKVKDDKYGSLANVTVKIDAPPPEAGSQFDEITYRAKVTVEYELKKP